MIAILSNKWVWRGVAALLIVVLALGWAGSARKRAVDGKEAVAEEKIAEGDMAASEGASSVTHEYYRTNERRVEIVRENADAIRNAPGSDQAVDGEFVAVLCDGLRRYESGRNVCASLRPTNTEGMEGAD